LALELGDAVVVVIIIINWLDCARHIHSALRGYAKLLYTHLQKPRFPVIPQQKYPSETKIGLRPETMQVPQH
jgi:hypothetical protein